MKDQKVYIIVAVDKNNGIGKDGKMAWNLKKEIEYFYYTTTDTNDINKQNMVIMGRTTWESIPKKNRPLKGRKNVVLTRQKDYEPKGAQTAGSLDEAIKMADYSVENIFILGGESVFAQAVNHPEVDGIFLTRIEKEYDCDAFFPQVPNRYSKIPEDLGSDEENDVKFKFLFYRP